MENCEKYDIVISAENADKSIDWMKRHPDWISDRIALIDKLS